MNALYVLLKVSKQGHMQSVRREAFLRSKEPCYIGLMETVREMHPMMGLRAMYEQFEPEGIGRDAFISLGLQEGYRVRAVESPMKTTRSVKNTRFRNLLGDLRLTGVNQVWVSDIFYFPLGGTLLCGLDLGRLFPADHRLFRCRQHAGGEQPCRAAHGHQAPGRVRLPRDAHTPL